MREPTERVDARVRRLAKASGAAVRAPPTAASTIAGVVKQKKRKTTTTATTTTTRVARHQHVVDAPAIVFGPRKADMDATQQQQRRKVKRPSADDTHDPTHLQQPAKKKLKPMLDTRTLRARRRAGLTGRPVHGRFVVERAARRGDKTVNGDAVLTSCAERTSHGCTDGDCLRRALFSSPSSSPGP